MRLKTEALKKICAECRRTAHTQGRTVECEAAAPCLYKFCERVYIYEIVDMKGDNF